MCNVVACVGLSSLDDERSVLGSMFSFMRATKKARHNPESEGIYLDDLNLDELDPEVAALYFPRNFKVPEKRGYNSYSSGMIKSHSLIFWINFCKKIAKLLIALLTL